MFPRHNGVATISESFTLKLIISVPLTKKPYLLHNAISNNFFLLFSVKLIEYSFSVDNVALSNPCVGPLPRTTIFFLFSYCQSL